MYLYIALFRTERSHIFLRLVSGNVSALTGGHKVAAFERQRIGQSVCRIRGDMVFAKPHHREIDQGMQLSRAGIGYRFVPVSLIEGKLRFAHLDAGGNRHHSHLLPWQRTALVEDFILDAALEGTRGALCRCQSDACEPQTGQDPCQSCQPFHLLVNLP